MKKSKLLIVLLLVALACLSLVACEQHVHTYKWAIDTKSTETAKGSATGTCICGETTTRELPALTDTAFWTVNTVDATHESAGSKTYTNAETELSIVVEIPAGEHTFGLWSIVTKATETTPGSAKRTCSGCNDDETMVLPVLADSSFWTVTTEAADHTKAGKNTYTNAATGLSIPVEIPVGAHGYGAWSISVEPTATATGTAVRSCACGAQDSATIAVLGDTSVWTVVHSQNASHAEGGVVVYSSIYGTVTTTSAKIDHTYGAWTITKDPTETETGSAIKICTCGHSVVEDVPVLSNNIWTIDDSNRPSHDAAGSVVYTSDYGTVTIAVPAGAHSFGNWTNNNDGTHTRTCDCGKGETVAHVFDQRVANSNTKKADATCTTGAKYAYSCVCGAVSTDDTFFNGEGTGHAFSEFTLTKEPTCTETGLASVKCTNCDYENDNSVIAALGHKWSTTYYPYYGSSQYWDADTGEVIVDEDTASESHVKVCTVCGIFDEDNKVAHAYGDEYLVARKDQNGHNISIEHACDCGYTAVVNDKLGYLEYAWTKGDEVPATYNNAGSIVYTRGNYTYTLAIPKLVAPYDGKTYHTIAVDSSSTTAISITDSWKIASVTLDANGKGTGAAFPFKGENVVTMGEVSGNVGQITWKVGTTTYNGYVDLTTGIAVVSSNNIRFFIMTCLDDAPSADQIGGATLGTSMAVSYRYNCSIGIHDFNFYIDNQGVVTFGVDFVDVNGSVIRANNIASANYVKIEKDGAKLAAFAKNSEGNFVATDGLEGTYTCVAGEDTVTFTVDGMGGISLSAPAGISIGTYAAVDDKTYYDAYVTFDGVKSYIQITFDVANGTCTFDQPMTTITYTTAHGTVDDSYKSVNTNIEFTLPTMELVTVEGQELAFAGWYFDEGYTRSAGTKITPTVDITLYAKWAPAVELTIQDENGTTVTKTVPSGSSLSEHVPAYEKGVTVSASGKKYFKGWMAGDVDLDNETIIEYNATIVAVWVDIPAYAGEYVLYDLYNEDGRYSTKKSFVIDYDGNITGNITGTVTSYDETTGKLVWSSGVMYVDTTTKFVVAPYSNITSSTITINDVYAGVIGVTASYTDYYNYGIKNASNSYCARFFKYNDLVAFWYNNAIYSNITITDALGNALSIIKSDSNSIANSATLVVKQGDTVIFSAAAENGKFSGGSATKDIDTYYGTYTLTDADSITFDGAGNFVWGDKNGTYTLTDADTKTFDVYVVASGKNTEYHVVTLDVDSKTYTSTKPMVNVSYESSLVPNETLTTPASVNKNIEITLPTITNDTKAFAGWYLKTDDTQAIVDSKQTITGDVTYVAKWVERSPFEGTYTMLCFNSTATSASTIWNSDTEKLIIDEFGKGTATASNGFTNGYAVSISFVEGSTSVVTITAGSPSSTSRTSYYGVYDAASGVIVRASGSTGFDTTVYMMVPYNANYVKEDFAMFAWKDGSTYRKFISFADRNAETETTRTIFIESATNVAFGVTWSAKDKNYADVTDLASVSANAVMFTVTAGETTYSYAKNSSNSFVTVTDTVQGKYTNGDDYVVLSGAGAIYFKDGTSGSYTVAEDGTISALTSTANYTITLDTSAKTFTKVDNKVTIKYYDGETELTDKQAAPYSGIKYTLIAGPEKEGYVFRGWYESADFSGSKVTSVTPTGDKTYYAKYDAAVTLTFDYNGYTDGETSSHSVTGKFVNDKVDIPTVLNDAKYGTKVFVGWFTANGTDGNWGDQVTTSTILTETTTTYYAKWIEPHAMMGTYKGAEVWGSTSSNTSNNLIVTSLGVASGTQNGTITDYNAETGYFKLVNGSKTYYGYHDRVNDIVVISYTSNTESFGTDAYFYFKDATTLSLTSANVVNWNGNKTRIIPFTVDGESKIIYINDTEVYCDVDVVDATGNSVAISSALKTAGTVITIKKGATSIVTYGYVGDTFVLSDGYQGTYTASKDIGIGSIALDGYGNATIGEAPVAYDLDSANSKITVVYNNRMYVLSLDKTTFKYTQVQDGYQGEYTMPDGTTKIELDGYGKVKETTNTYVVSGATITIYDGETSTTYGIDKTTETLLGKSIFAGLKFNKSDSQYVQFADTPEISGKYVCGNSGWYVTFTGTYDAEACTLTCTVVTQSGNAAAIGSTFTFTVFDGQLVLATGSFSSNVEASIGFTYTNADFVLA